MNTTILEAYKALPYGENFIAWLESKDLLETFITRVEERCNREGHSLEFYANRCIGEEPREYVTLSLYYCQCAEGQDFWVNIDVEWNNVCRLNGYARLSFTFDSYQLVKTQYCFDAFTLEEAEQMYKQYIHDNGIDAIAHELAYTKHND